MNEDKKREMMRFFSDNPAIVIVERLAKRYTLLILAIAICAPPGLFVLLLAAIR